MISQTSFYSWRKQISEMGVSTLCICASDYSGPRKVHLRICKCTYGCRGGCKRFSSLVSWASSASRLLAAYNCPHTRRPCQVHGVQETLIDRMGCAFSGVLLLLVRTLLHVQTSLVVAGKLRHAVAAAIFRLASCDYYKYTRT